MKRHIKGVIGGKNTSTGSNKNQNYDQFNENIPREQIYSKTNLNFEQFSGIYNTGNICYCSSVLQALYACAPFRNRVLGYKSLLNSNKQKTKNGNNANGNDRDDDQMSTSMTDSGFYHSTFTNSQQDENNLKPEDFDERAYNKLASSVTPKKVARDCVDQIWNLMNKNLNHLNPNSNSQDDAIADEKNDEAQISDKVTESAIKNIELSTSDIINLIYKERVTRRCTASNQLVSHNNNHNNYNISRLIRNQAHKQDLMRFTGDSLLLALNELFLSMYFSKEAKKKSGKAGRIDNKKFIHKLQSVNAIFDNCIQHDAHELLVTLLSSVSETLEHEELIKLIFELKTRRELIAFLEEASLDGMEVLQDSMMSLSLRSENGRLRVCWIRIFRFFLTW